MKIKGSSIILILCASFATAMAQILLKIGSKLKVNVLKDELIKGGLYSIKDILNIHSEMFHFFMISMGFFLFMVTLVILAKGFKGGDMSVLYPLFASSFIWNIIFSRIVLGENITLFKIIGVLIIITGIGLIGFGHERNTGEAK